VEREQPADWEASWRAEPLRRDAPELESRTLRWRAQERLILERFGTFAGLDVVEIGAGRGLNALLFAVRGARVTLIDRTELALEQARWLFDQHGVDFTPVVADALRLSPRTKGSFDVAMSYGLCEHFLGRRRRRIVGVHLDLLRYGGLALIGVPNRRCPPYRLWKAVLTRRGTWPLGTEEPFTAGELEHLARVEHGGPLSPLYGGLAASVVDHGLNQLLYKLGRRGVPIPQIRLPLLDRLAYELVVPVARNVG
jgi:SAM-dependent methyltransferase